MKSAFTYGGQELELFGNACNWKRYVASYVKKFIRGAVAEVGAGMGNFTPYLQTHDVSSWTYIEPDKRFRKMLERKMDHLQLRSGPVLASSTDVHPSSLFDTIIYMDVIEHIEDDKEEISRMTAHLNPGGHIILLAPAHPCLYSAFDKEIGHFRRYSRQRLTGLFDRKSNIILCKHLDSAGFFASLGNRLFLRQRYPTKIQVGIWDSVIVPCSRFTDRLVLHSFGKSLVIVWQNIKPGEQA